MNIAFKIGLVCIYLHANAFKYLFFGTCGDIVIVMSFERPVIRALVYYVKH